MTGLSAALYGLLAGRQLLHTAAMGLGFLVLTLTSCGEAHRAKGHVEQFMKGPMSLEQADRIAWSDLDSTHHLTDSMLQVMRRTAEQTQLVKPGTAYQPRTAKLRMLTLKYAVGKDTLMATFYLDDQLAGIVGVKRTAMVNSLEK